MIMEPDGKELFRELCNRLDELKFVTHVGELEPSRAESVSYFFDEGDGHESRLTRPVAEVQYISGKQPGSENEIIGVSLVFNYELISPLGLDSVIEKYKRYRSELKGQKGAQVYQYIFVDCISSNFVYPYIDALFTDLHLKLNSNQHHTSLTNTSLDESDTVFV
ncbi:hypothetical protein [Niallia sp. Krafla_26]|uniref:hypothetical protein n=1 Tax=Niallia sp. Krafla_26 TaxID=3064703 RepID=UPI003D16C72F